MASCAGCAGPDPVIHLALPPDLDPGVFSVAIAADSRGNSEGILRAWCGTPTPSSATTPRRW
eukprot:8532234-Alexandrium_andersonii.AAC.1